MKTRMGLLLVLALAGGGFLFWWFSPTQEVKRRTTKLMRTISFEKGQGRAARQSGVYVLSSLLAPDVELSAEEHDEVNGMFPREQVEAGFNWLADRVVVSSFDVVAFEKIVFREQKFAEVDLVVDAEMLLPDRKVLDGRHVVFLVWENHDTGWRLSHARWSGPGKGE